MGRAMEGSPLKVSEGEWPWQHLDFRLLGFRIMIQYIEAYFKPPVCDTFLQPRKYIISILTNDNYVPLVILFAQETHYISIIQKYFPRELVI